MINLICKRPRCKMRDRNKCIIILTTSSYFCFNISYSTFREVLYTVLLKRRPLFHIFSFILPCGLLSMLNLLAFLLPTESGEKVSLGITNLLALVLFQQLIADSLPPSSSDMPIISKSLSYIITCSCTLETSLICILLLASRDVHFDKRMIYFLSDLL